MKTIYAIALLLLVFHLPAQAQKAKKTSKVKTTRSMLNTKYLIGTWELQQAPSGGNMGMSQTWEFNGADFKMYGYPQIQQKGRYTVKKDSASVLVLRLYGQEGNRGTGDKDLTLQIDRTKGVLSMNSGSLEFKKKEP